MNPPRGRRSGPAPAPGARGAPPGRVRIIAGRFRRTPITVIEGDGLRPTPERVRETLFNWLHHRLGAFDELVALDLFAGSGALGFELASRGARSVLLVDHHAAAVAALRALQSRLQADNVRVVHADWRAALRGLEHGSLDVIFLDPPFGSDLLDAVLPAVRPLLAPGGLVYVEAPERLAPARLEAWKLWLACSGRAGAVHFHLLCAGPC